MRFGEVVDATTASALQTSWLYAQLEPVSEFGRRAFAQVAPYRPGQEHAAQVHSQTIADLARTLTGEQVDAMRDALRSSPDPVPAISRASMGGILEDANLLELLRFLDAAKRAQNSLIADCVQDLAASLELGRSGKFAFYLSEKFDGDLAAARANADRAQAEYDSARGRLAQRIAHDLGREEIAGGEFIVMRDLVQTLPRGIRIVREAPTYYLCELELDDSALGALRRRDEANEAVATAEESVRRNLSNKVRACVADLECLVTDLAELDVRLAQARFTQRYACIPARILDSQALCFQDARYLPLQEELEAKGRRYEPISIDLHDVTVLTGPNMGGKTVALRTCGFIALLTAFGIPVPAAQAQCALFESIAWLGIGAQEELGGLLSSFAREVVRLNELLMRPASRMLLLVDEFARTTTPHEGKALLVAILRGLRRRERLAFIATHLAGIAADAGVRHFAVRGLRDVPPSPVSGDLNAALSALAESMDYAVVEVAEEGERQADAIALAQLLGLDEDIVAEAKESLWTR